jgi:hypothetical protein
LLLLLWMLLLSLPLQDQLRVSLRAQCTRLGPLWWIRLLEEPPTQLY